MVLRALSRAVDGYKERKERLMDKLSLRQQQLLRIALFFFRFSILVLPLHFLLWANWDVYFLQKQLAGGVAVAMRLLGVSVRQDHHFLIFAGWGTVEIIKDCLGWKSVMALFGLIFAVDKINMKERVKGLVLGIVLLILGNYLRLVTTFYAVVAWGANFQVIHSFLWRWGLMFLILGYWTLWFKKFRAKTNSKSRDQ